MSHFQIKGYASVCIEVLVTQVRQIQPHIKLGSYYSYRNKPHVVGTAHILHSNANAKWILVRQYFYKLPFHKCDTRKCCFA